MGLFDRKHPANSKVKTTVRDPNAMPRPVGKGSARPSRDSRYSRGSSSARGYRERFRDRSVKRVGRVILMGVAVVVLALIVFGLLSLL